MHGVIALLDSPMVLLQAVIEVFVRSMEHLIPQRFTHSAGVGGVLSELRPRPEKLASSGERPFQKERSVGTSNAKKGLFGVEVGKVSLVSLSVV
jgi:hypothetical protein